MPGNSAYLKAWDEFDHHSLILTKSNKAGLVHMAFKVETLDDLAYYEKKVEEFGCITSRISSHTRLAEGEALHFILPTGHRCELYYEIGFLGNGDGELVTLIHGHYRQEGLHHTVLIICC